MAYQAGNFKWMSDNMMHSIATILRIDIIAVATHLRNGTQVRKARSSTSTGRPKSKRHNTANKRYDTQHCYTEAASGSDGPTPDADQEGNTQ
jgi:hypothetical protein